MTPDEAIARLRPELLDVIEAFVNARCERPEWEAIGYVGDNYALHMTNAALSVLAAIADTNAYIKQNAE